MTKKRHMKILQGTISTIIFFRVKHKKFREVNSTETTFLTTLIDHFGWLDIGLCLFSLSIPPDQKASWTSSERVTYVQFRPCVQGVRVLIKFSLWNYLNVKEVVAWKKRDKQNNRINNAIQISRHNTPQSFGQTSLMA